MQKNPQTRRWRLVTKLLGLLPHQNLPPWGSTLSAKKKPRPARTRGQWWEVKEHGRTSDYVIPGAGVPEEVADCVCYSILAARQNIGEFMWMGYTCLGKHKSDISTGTHFLMATTFAAKVLEDAMRREECERGPIDVSFKKWLLSGGY